MDMFTSYGHIKKPKVGYLHVLDIQNIGHSERKVGYLFETLDIRNLIFRY